MKFRLVIEVEGELPYSWSGTTDEPIGKELHFGVQNFMDHYQGKEIYKVKEGESYE